MALPLAAPAQSFSYPTLQDAAKEIRLLRIVPDQDPNINNSILRVELGAFKQEKSLVYHALSYAWGDASKTTPIILNGSPFDVTDILYAAMLQLRDFDGTPGLKGCCLFWIDALKDGREKSLQVQMMRDIYNDATQVIVWLGASTPWSGIGMRAIARLTKSHHEYKSSKSIGDKEDDARHKRLYGMLRLLTDMDIMQNDAIGLAVEQVFAMPWWSRIWIIQEVASAKQAVFMLGSDVLELFTFRHLLFAMAELGEIPDSKVTAGWSILSTRISLGAFQAQNVLSYWLESETSLLEAFELLLVTGSSQATDPRDMLYALIGLRVDVEAMVGKVDYSISWQVLYTKAAWALLVDHGLHALSFCSLAKSHQHDRLPSWVPNWSKRPTKPLQFSSKKLLYNAGGKTTLSKPIRGNAQELQLEGIRVAKITNVRAPWSIPPDAEQPINPRTIILATRKWHKSLVALASALDLPHEKVEELVRRTITADTVADSSKRRLRLDDDIAAYRAFLSTFTVSASESMMEHPLDLSYGQGVYAVANSRRPFKSHLGHLGIGLDTTELGDIICIFHGARVPFLLRRQRDGRFRLIGEAYVDGIMDGQVTETTHTTETFVLC